FFFSSRRRHTRFSRDWSSDVCSSDLVASRFLHHRPHPLRSQATARPLPAGTWTGQHVLDGQAGPTLGQGVKLATENDVGRTPARSEERRVGKGGRARWSARRRKDKR